MADWMTWGDSSPLGGGGALTADIVTRIEHEAEADVTAHPIETGAEISDHVVIKPRRVTFEFGQGKQPMRFGGGQYTGLGANAVNDEVEWSQVGINPIPSRFQPTGLLAITRAAESALKAIGSAIGLLGGSALEVWALTAKDDEDRIHRLHDQLLTLQKDAEQVSFQYGGLVLQSYVITSIGYSREVPGGIVKFTVEAQEIKTVATETSVLGGLADALPGALKLLPEISFGKKGVDEIEASAIDHSLIPDSTLQGIGI